MTQWGLDTLFNPAKRHMDDEKRRLQSTREEVGDNSGGKRIDLESGKVVIKKAEDDDVEDGADPEDGAGVEDGANDDVESDAAAPTKSAELTPAQLRAARRRGRAV